MKKNILKTGILTIGMLSVLNNNIKVYANEYKYIKEENIEEELVKDYARVFEIDEDVVLDKMIKLTGNFKYWKKQKILVNGSSYDYDYIYEINDKKYTNLEVAILETVRDISKHPENYNLTYEDISTEYEYTTDKCGEEILKYYSDLLNINENAALPIMYEECFTDLSSNAYVRQGNPAGMGPGNTYKNIEVGIIEYVYLLKYNNPYNFTEETDVSVYDRIGRTYCTVGTDGWIKNTKKFYYDISDNYYYYADMYGKEHTDYDKVIKLH